METLTHRETLAGHHGSSGDFQHSRGLGSTRRPFAWLSPSLSSEQMQVLADELREIKRTRTAVPFEEWAFQDERWHRVRGEMVHVIYVEVGDRSRKVLAILQWVRRDGAAEAETPDRPSA